MKYWLPATMILAIFGFALGPAIVLASGDCCGGGEDPLWLKFIVAPILPYVLLLLEVCPERSLIPLCLGSVLGYGLIPTYVLLVRKLIRALITPCHK